MPLVWADARNRQVKHYSGGMRRRLDIAASIVVSPDLLFLDEPTTGLDPRSRRTIWDVIRALRQAGTTVLLTTQYLEEADELADRIVILDQGKLIADGIPSQLKSSFASSTLRMRLQNEQHGPRAVQILSQTLGISAQIGSDHQLYTGKKLQITTRRGEPSLPYTKPTFL